MESPLVRLSVIVVTLGRPTLERTLRSIAAQDVPAEVLVVGDAAWARERAAAYGYRFVQDGPYGCWGQQERQEAMKWASGTHLLFMDDDDFYTSGAFATVRSRLLVNPTWPHMFRMLAPTGHCLWLDMGLRGGNVAGTMFVTPNHNLGTWGLRREGDFDFIASTLAQYDNRMIWCPEVIAGCRDQGVPAWKILRRDA